MRLFFFSILTTFSLCFASYKTYPFTNEPIDVVIPCHPKDVPIVSKAIVGAKKNVVNIGNVYIISPEPFTEEAIWIDERSFPFSYLFDKDTFRIYEKIPEQILATAPTWLYQQLLKLYVFEQIPTLSSNVLLLDADTVLLKPISFINSSGEPYYPTGTKNYRPYFNYAKKLLPKLHRVFPEYSGIVNFMLVQKSVMQDLFYEIQKIHQCAPWEAMIKCYSPDYVPSWASDLTWQQLHNVRISEYEIYFNFLFSRTKQAHLLQIKWANVREWDDAALIRYEKEGYYFISAHAWARF